MTTQIITVQATSSQSTFDTLKTRQRPVCLLSEKTGEKDKDGKAIKDFHTLNVTIPDWFPSDTTFESFDNMVAHLSAIDENLPLAVMQSGIAQELIQVWTKPKPVTKNKVTEDIWAADYVETALERTAKYKPEPMKRPNANGTKKVTDARLSDCFAMIGTLTTNGMDKETIKGMVTPIYGAEIVKTVFNTLENINAE